VKYVGPLQWYPPDDSHAILNALPDHCPWIHVTEGTLHVRDSFLLRAAAEGLASLPVQVIAGVFDSRTPNECGINPVPANMRLVKWINHRELLPRTSVMVTTGGGGTVMAGMQHGVPLVVVPTEWDKAENAQRVVEAGAGIRLTPRQCTSARLRSAIQEILNDERYRRNARRIASSLAGRGGPERAAGLIEEMLGCLKHDGDSLARTGGEEQSCRFP
jgi:MGT family glycosyltransferase